MNKVARCSGIVEVDYRRLAWQLASAGRDHQNRLASSRLMLAGRRQLSFGMFDSLSWYLAQLAVTCAYRSDWMIRIDPNPIRISSDWIRSDRTGSDLSESDPMPTPNFDCHSPFQFQPIPIPAHSDSISF
ncbi:hypothetical protein WN943_006320 [Citrus x changshan-huyou]